VKVKQVLNFIYFLAFCNKYTAKIPNKILGVQTAIAGEKSDCSDKVPNTLSKNTNVNAMAIPMAKFTPIPPLRFIDETETAIMVSFPSSKISG
jgi:hypothetical protein